jgi:hypothetical protein
MQLGFFEDAARGTVALCVLPAFADSWLAYTLVMFSGAADGLCVFHLALLCFGALMTAVTRPKRALWVVLAVSLHRWAATGLLGLTHRPQRPRPCCRGGRYRGPAPQPGTPGGRAPHALNTTDTLYTATAQEHPWNRTSWTAPPRPDQDPRRRRRHRDRRLRRIPPLAERDRLHPTPRPMPGSPAVAWRAARPGSPRRRPGMPAARPAVLPLHPGVDRQAPRVRRPGARGAPRTISACESRRAPTFQATAAHRGVLSCPDP